jgi:S1-C subfamily serine protease
MVREDFVRWSFSRTRRSESAAIAAMTAITFTCAALPFTVRSTQAQAQAQANAADESGIASVCPVVYPDDQSPAAHGYHYTFFGNAFFINDEGYLLTVAHVLETFRDGGQPYVLVNRPNSPPKLLQVTVIAKDPAHDVAILRATPNPFVGKFSVTSLPLAAEPAVRGQSVLALSLHPQRLQNAYSFESTREDSSPGTVLSFESTQLEKSAPAADVFLLSHPVVKGQSGSPVLTAGSHAVVGLVEGLWLRGTSVSLAKSSALPTGTPGAAIPIRYAIALLKEHDVSWRTAASAIPVPTPGKTPQSGSTGSKPAVERPEQP